MVELKQIGRLYPQQIGHVLLVGEMSGPLEITRERTAAELYCYLLEGPYEPDLIVSSTMQDLLHSIEVRAVGDARSELTRAQRAKLYCRMVEGKKNEQTSFFKIEEW